MQRSWDRTNHCVTLFRGRVLFLLVGFLPAHTTPEHKLSKLDDSIDKFRQSLRLDSENKTDVEFNLAQALHLRSEILQETSEIENAYGQSALGKLQGWREI